MSVWKGRRVLVTGAAGFIGCAIAQRLLADKAIVTCLVRTSGWQEDIDLGGATVYEGDVSDYRLLCEIISTNEIEYVFHLAANAIVRVGARDPMSTYQTNVMGTVALLEAVRNVGKTVRKVIVASSDKAYGDHVVLPYKESMALQPKNTYDTSKACADMIARTYAHNYGLPICVTRCSNVYGPGDPNMSRIIPNSICRLIRGECPQLYSDVAEMEREFIYIDDVVEAFLLLGDSSDLINGFAYNVGGTGPVKVERLVEQIIEQMNVEPGVIEVIPRDPEFKEIQKQYISAVALSAATGWTPKVRLEDGLRRTIRYYKARVK